MFRVQHAAPLTHKRDKSSAVARWAGPGRAGPGRGLADWKQREMLSNQGLGKTKPTMTKLRNHLQHKEPDGLCLALVKEKPKQRLIL